MKVYDYSSAGAYFVTVCTRDRRNFFWTDVGAGIARPQDVLLTPCGELVKRSLMEIPERYPGIILDHYVIMPNHIHILLRIREDDGRAVLAPTVSTVIQQMKGNVTKRAGFSVWQKSFYDHVVRNEHDFREIWNYIETNPVKWKDDRFYMKGEVAHDFPESHYRT